MQYLIVLDLRKHTKLKPLQQIRKNTKQLSFSAENYINLSHYVSFYTMLATVNVVIKDYYMLLIKMCLEICKT